MVLSPFSAEGSASGFSSGGGGVVLSCERRVSWALTADTSLALLMSWAANCATSNEADPVSAIERIIALDQAEDMLGRDIATIDLRNEHRPTIRLLGGRVAALENFNGFQTKVPSQ